MRTNGTWSAKITIMIAQNQTCFLKCQRILMAMIISPNTMQAANAISALARRVMTKNTGDNIKTTIRPV